MYVILWTVPHKRSCFAARYVLWEMGLLRSMLVWLRRFQHIRLSAFSAASLLLLTACAKRQGGPINAAPTQVSVATVEQRDVPLYGDWVATLDGYVNAQIQPQVSGYLIKQDYREGSVVESGQVLFEIDPRPFQATLDQSEGQLAQAQAQLGLANINVKRDTPLAAAHAIAESQLDNDVQQQASQRASVRTAEANVEQAQLNLGFTKVRSLVTGIAGRAQTQVGNLVSPSTTLTTVSQVNPIKVYFSISEQEYLALSGRVKAKGKADLLSSGNTVPLQLTLGNGNTYPAKGQIVFVDRQVNPQTGTLQIAGSFPNPQNLLRPGQFGRIKAETEVRHDALMVP
ncbi:MAG: rane fusion protein multidrug efflux system, partial [Acidobacteriaceae bacterium]|nr:rane fusion protein multidrug efflux system [Acidobacteriaceae bacterium]